MLSFPQWDTDLFIRLNGAHADWLDPVMQALSSSTFWIPFYVVLAYFMVRKERWLGLAAIAFMALAFGLADQLSVILFKENFQRLRPCHVQDLQGLVHSLENCGGQYGFISNHAANTFCLAIFTSCFFRNKYYACGVFLWAAAVSYSRIYVGKHFPLDVMCGAAFGMLCGLFGYSAYRMLKRFIARRSS